MLNRKLICGVTGAGVLAALAACAPYVAVRTDSAADMSVGICHTYAFADEHVANGDQPAAYANPINAERLRVSIQSNLTAKGLQLVDRAAADCVVGYAMGTRQVFASYYGGDFRDGWGWCGRGAAGAAMAGARVGGGGTMVPGCKTKPALPWMFSTPNRTNPSGTPAPAK